MIPAAQAHLHVAAGSHPGMSGKNNEDRYGVSAFRLGAQDSTPAVLALVADGIGGHLAGEVAAEIAVESISQDVAESDGRHPLETLKAALLKASQAIHTRAAADPRLEGMGATCVCAWVIADRLYIAYVGDSRLYLARKGTIRQLTRDHTWVQEALEAGALTPEQARNHPNQHVIRRYLGSRKAVRPDTRLILSAGEGDLQSEHNQGTRLQPGDQLLLCSDGLTDLVEEEEILAALETQPLEQAVEQLIALANQRGGHDNITLIALQVPRRGASGWRARFRRAALLACLGLVLLLLVAAATTALLLWFYSRPASETLFLPLAGLAARQPGLPFVVIVAGEHRGYNIGATHLSCVAPGGATLQSPVNGAYRLPHLGRRRAAG